MAFSQNPHKILKNRNFARTASHRTSSDLVPGIQRSSLAGSVLYLKSLGLPDIDILKFDFLDSPSSESLQDALKQLYLIDDIDEMVQLQVLDEKWLSFHLEPSLSRILREADNYGCITEALTVAAMLSTGTALLPAQCKTKKRGNVHYLTFLTTLAWVTTFNYCRYMSDGIKLILTLVNAKTMACGCGELARDVCKHLSHMLLKIVKEPLDIKALGNLDFIGKKFNRNRFEAEANAGTGTEINRQRTPLYLKIPWSVSRQLMLQKTKMVTVPSRGKSDCCKLVNVTLNSFLEFQPELWGLPPFDDWVDNTLPIEPIHQSD